MNVSAELPRSLLRPASGLAVMAASLALAIGAALIGHTDSWRQATLYVIGAATGAVLYRASFGFTGAWRLLLAEGRGEGLRAHMLMLAVATVLFFPVLSNGALFGTPVVAAIAPVGVSVLVGALVFGIGMQLAGGCASGMLYSLGGGNVRMVLTLATFILGAVIGSAHLPWWLEQPSFGSISLLEQFGWMPALLLQLGVIAAIVVATGVLERRRHARSVGGEPRLPRLRDALWVPRRLLLGAIALAVLNFATLAVAGHPWSITFAFSLWGAKLAAGVGIDVASWTFWTWPFPQQALAASIFADTTSVMDLGLVVGALFAAGLAERFSPNFWIPLRSAAAAALGGLLMGYGARLGFGCNIGAFFSGVASGSLHGWLWFAAALAGNAIGIRLRPFFAPQVERALQPAEVTCPSRR